VPKKPLFPIVFVVAAALAAPGLVVAENPDGRTRPERRGSMRPSADVPRDYSSAVDSTPVYVMADRLYYSAWAYRSEGEYSIAISFREGYYDWSEPVFIGLGDGLDQIRPALASDDHGNLYLAYIERQSGQVWMTALWRARTTWFAPQQIAIGMDRAVTPALAVVNGDVVLGFESEMLGVRLFHWETLPPAPTGYQTDGIQEGPDGFPVSGWAPTDTQGGGHDINVDRDDNTTGSNGSGNQGSSTRARSNGRTH